MRALGRIALLNKTNQTKTSNTITTFRAFGTHNNYNCFSRDYRSTSSIIPTIKLNSTNFFYTNKRRYTAAVNEDDPILDEEEAAPAEETPTENDRDSENFNIMTSIPDEKERIEFYENFKIGTELDCAKFTRIMRSLPLRQLSLDEQDVLFRKREVVEKRLKYLQKIKENEASADAIFNAIDDLYIGETQPIINPSLKENIYETWVQSPTQWTLEKLAQRFRLKKLRVRAILMLKIDEKRLLKSNPEAVVPEGDDIDYEYARYYGMIGKNQHFVDEVDERFVMDYKTSPFKPFFSITDEEVDGEKMKRCALKKRKFPDTLPADPPNPDSRNDNTEMWGPDPLVLEGKVGRKRLKRKAKNTLVVMFNPDVPILQEKVNGLIYVVRPDGSARTATWDERRSFWRKSARGEWASKTQPADRIALDPIYFPVDEKEERLMKLQNKDPKIQNRKWNKPVIITEKETFIHRMTSKNIGNVFTAWEKYKKKYGELTPETTVFDAPPPTAPYAGTPVVYY